jgi:N-acetylglutamate synthase-like GNAT family acetyltransferase
MQHARTLSPEKISKGYATAAYYSSEFTKQNLNEWSFNHDELNAALLDQAPNKFIVQDNNRIVGAIAFNVHDDCINIEHVGSLQAGVGSLLMKRAEDFARRKKLKVTLVSSDVAKGFYAKRGYKSVDSSQLLMLEP